MSDTETNRGAASPWAVVARRACVAAIVALVLVLGTGYRPAFAQSSVGGLISNTSTNVNGVQVLLATGATPANCSSANASGWLLISAQNKAMISAALIAAALGSQVMLYSDGTVTAVGSVKYCNIVQITSSLR